MALYEVGSEKRAVIRFRSASGVGLDFCGCPFAGFQFTFRPKFGVLRELLPVIWAPHIIPSWENLVLIILFVEELFEMHNNNYINLAFLSN